MFIISNIIWYRITLIELLLKFYPLFITEITFLSEHFISIFICIIYFIIFWMTEKWVWRFVFDCLCLAFFWWWALAVLVLLVLLLSELLFYYNSYFHIFKMFAFLFFRRNMLYFNLFVPCLIQTNVSLFQKVPK